MDRIKMEDLNLELVKLRSAERLRVQNQAKVEAMWWGNSQITNIEEAIKSGVLVKTPAELVIERNGYQLTGKLIRGEEPDLARPATVDLLSLITRRWAYMVGQLRLGSSPTFLSVSSLFRSIDVQADYFKAGLNAAEVSAHPAGFAIDFDASGYYKVVDDAKKSVKRKDTDFNRGYLEALKKSIEGLEYDGACHFIQEKKFEMYAGKIVEFDSCYHVCVSPEFANQR